ncbi:hypothetical protein Tco_0873780 [Tanacetum coccineum]|uniref:Zinc finger, CCHC-type, retrotransposon Gag domain protein n=1 Tax=Tanacetum coccineum TaxID=301880 RepID=A0ABQ5BNX5_9ASTR
MVNTRTDAELAAAVQAAVDAMLPQIREQVREEYRTGAVASGSNPPPVTIHTWLERFNKQKPRSFEKAVAPVDAENWISHMEKIFDVMDCNDAFKTRLAVYKFEGDALAWWKAYKQAKGGDAWVLTLTWAAFKELKGNMTQQDTYLNLESLLSDDTTHNLSPEVFFDHEPQHDTFSPKSDPLHHEFTGELITIPPRIVREHEDYINRMSLLCGNSSSQSPENSHTIIESLPTSTTLVEDSDSNREEIDIMSGPDDIDPPV